MAPAVYGGSVAVSNSAPIAAEAVVQRGGGFIGADGRGAAAQDVPGVQSGRHFHYGDAGFRLVIEDGPLDGRRAAMPGQEGGVDIDAAEPRQIQHRRG